MPTEAIHPTPPPQPSLPWLGGIYVALLLLLGATVAAAHFPLGPFALVVALAIAGAKAALVVLYFMHVRHGSRVTWLFVAAGVVWLSILFTLTFSEYLGRTRLSRADPLPAAPAAQRPTPLEPIRIDTQPNTQRVRTVANVNA
jgi:cytochrome c oxidase subunit 4